MKNLFILLLAALPALAQTRSAASGRASKVAFYALNKSGANPCTEFSGELTGNWWCGDAPSLSLSAATGMTLTATSTGNLDSPFYRSGPDKGAAIAQSFNGTTSRFTTSSVASPTGNFSCWAFFRTDVTANNYQPIITKATNGNYEFQMYRNGAVSTVTVDLYSTTALSTSFTSPSNMLTSGWHFVVFAYQFVADNTSVGTVWLDGTAGTTISTAHGPMFAETIPWRAMSRESGPFFTQGAGMSFGCTEKLLSADTIAKMTRAAFGGRGLTQLAVAASDTPTYELPVTTTRASAARFVANGQVALVGSGVARVTTNGLVDEPTATNLALQSETFNNASWSKVADVTISADAVVAPDGQTTADGLVENNTTNTSYTLQQSVTGTNGSPHVVSVYAKKGPLALPNLYVDLYDGTDHYSFFDLSTGSMAVGAVCSGCTALPGQALANGWVRISMRLASAASASLIPVFGGTTSNSVAGHVGVVGATTYLWGAQVEVGTNATGYIPTTTTSVARSADLTTDSTARTGSVTPSASADFTFAAAPATAGTIVRYRVDSSNELILNVQTNSTVRCNISTGGTAHQANSAATTAGVKHHASCSYDGANVQVCLDGTCTTSAQSFTPATAYTIAGLGSHPTVTGQEINGTVSGVCLSDTATGCK